MKKSEIGNGPLCHRVAQHLETFKYDKKLDAHKMRDLAETLDEITRRVLLIPGFAAQQKDQTT